MRYGASIHSNGKLKHYPHPLRHVLEGGLECVGVNPYLIFHKKSWGFKQKMTTYCKGGEWNRRTRVKGLSWRNCRRKKHRVIIKNKKILTKQECLRTEERQWQIGGEVLNCLLTWLSWRVWSRMWSSKEYFLHFKSDSAWNDKENYSFSK